MVDKDKNQRRKFSIANRFQRKILTLVFFSTIIPMAIAVVCLYYFTFYVITWEVGFPDVLAYSIIPAARKVALIAITGFAFSVLLLWLWALKVSHRLAGPLERLCRELDARISDKEKGFIYFRRKDYLAVLAGRINSLLERIKR